MSPEERTGCAAILRAVADLVEAGEATGDLDARLTFWAQHTPDQPAAVRAIVRALPLRWSGKSSPGTGGGGDWYDLKASTEGVSGLHGIAVTVHANADAVATEAGTRTITEWAPSPEIAALLDQNPEAAS